MSTYAINRIQQYQEKHIPGIGLVGPHNGVMFPMKKCETHPVLTLFVPYRHVRGSAALVAALSKVPAHEEKRRQLTSLLRNIENQTRSDIAETARSAAELR